MLGIVKENLCGVCDAEILLSLSASTVDAGCSFGGISTHEAEGDSRRLKRRKGKGERKRDVPLLVEEENIGTTFEKSVCCREAGKTTTDYDDLCHVEVD
jgi:hypothetical protein